MNKLEVLRRYSSYIKIMTNAETVLVGNQYPIPHPSISSYVNGIVIYVSGKFVTSELINGRISKWTHRLKTINERLSSKPFLEKAPKEVVERNRKEARELEEKLIIGKN